MENHWVLNTALAKCVGYHDVIDDVIFVLAGIIDIGTQKGEHIEIIYKKIVLDEDFKVATVGSMSRRVYLGKD